MFEIKLEKVSIVSMHSGAGNNQAIDSEIASIERRKFRANQIARLYDEPDEKEIIPSSVGLDQEFVNSER